MSADELKAKGNAAFSGGNFAEAIGHFTAAIGIAPTNHVLYSNRSAAYASESLYDEALADAEKVVELKPDWPKGFSRLGAARYGLGEYDTAAEAYREGLSLDPGNELLKRGLEDAEAARARARRGPPAGGLFSQPEVLGRLAADPRTRGYLAQPDFMEMMQAINTDPSAMQRYLADDRFQTALQVGLGLNIMTPDEAGLGGDKVSEEPVATATTKEEGEAPPPQAAPPAQKSPPAQAFPRSAAPAPSAAPMDAEPAAPVAGDRAAAVAAKEAGNAAYKSRQFDEAIARYTEAIALDDTDISFLSNRAAAQFEKGDYDACAADCDAAVSRGREVRADYKLVARAIARKGNALVKKGDLAGAVECYQKSLTEHRSADTLNRLNEAQRALKEREASAYVDLDLAVKAKDEGNEAFKAHDFPRAVRLYSEALKRGPPDVYEDAYKLFSNRAACYTKLGAWQEGLRDAEECIRLRPDFAKGYSRKGHLQFFMKEYSKARETYEAGLAHDPDNAELREGLVRTVTAVNRAARGEGTEEERRQQQDRALADPEVQSILTDPVMRQVLRDMEENPAAAQKHLANAQVAAKFEKLVAAGIVQIR